MSRRTVITFVAGILLGSVLGAGSALVYEVPVEKDAGYTYAVLEEDRDGGNQLRIIRVDLVTGEFTMISLDDWVKDADGRNRIWIRDTLTREFKRPTSRRLRNPFLTPPTKKPGDRPSPTPS